MLRKMAVGLAAVVIATAGSGLSASAKKGGGPGGPGMMKPGAKGGPGKFGPGPMAKAKPIKPPPPGVKPPHKPHVSHWEYRKYTTYSRGGYYGGPRYYGGGYGGGGSCWRYTPEGNRYWVCGYRGHGYYGGGYGYSRPSYRRQTTIIKSWKGKH